MDVAGLAEESQAGAFRPPGGGIGGWSLVAGVVAFPRYHEQIGRFGEQVDFTISGRCAGSIRRVTEAVLVAEFVLESDVYGRYRSLGGNFEKGRAGFARDAIESVFAVETRVNAIVRVAILKEDRIHERVGTLRGFNRLRQPDLAAVVDTVGE